MAEVQDLGLDDLPAALLRGEVGLGQEHLADGDALVRQGVAAALDVLGEEVLRDLDMDAGAVPGLAVRIHRAAVPHGLQRIDAGLHHVPPGRAVERGDEAHAAVRVLVLRAIGFVQQGGVGVPVGDVVHGERSF